MNYRKEREYYAKKIFDDLADDAWEWEFYSSDEKLLEIISEILEEFQSKLSIHNKGK